MRLVVSFRSALLCMFVFGFVEARADLSPKQARKLITRMPGFNLPTSAVRVKRISVSGDSSAEAEAEIQIAFRLTQNTQGHWRILEVRTGPNQWEPIEFIAGDKATETAQRGCDASDLRSRAFSSEPSVKRARCLFAGLLGVQLPSDAVRIKSISTLALPLASSSSAVAETVVHVELRFTREKSGWLVTGIRSGSGDWLNPQVVFATISDEKRKKARAELEEIASALEVFRAQRGFYVPAEMQHILMDHLSPRYLSRVIRIDPWHQPYRYSGERDRFTLSSTGPDGKEHTADDILVRKPFAQKSLQGLPN